MKKSQIVLGASAFVLAIAAAFTSKVKADVNQRTFITIFSMRVDVANPGCSSGAKSCTIVTMLRQTHHRVYNKTALGRTFPMTRF